MQYGHVLTRCVLLCEWPFIRCFPCSAFLSVRAHGLLLFLTQPVNAPWRIRSGFGAAAAPSDSVQHESTGARCSAVCAARRFGGCASLVAKPVFPRTVSVLVLFCLCLSVFFPSSFACGLGMLLFQLFGNLLFDAAPVRVFFFSLSVFSRGVTMFLFISLVCFRSFSVLLPLCGGCG